MDHVDMTRLSATGELIRKTLVFPMKLQPARTSDGRVMPMVMELSGATYLYRDAIRQIPGARWNAAEKTWWVPVNPTSRIGLNHLVDLMICDLHETQIQNESVPTAPKPCVTDEFIPTVFTPRPRWEKPIGYTNDS